MSSSLRLLTIHAHADDETITMGGLLALCADRGIETCVICCTDGKVATIVDPSMPEEETRPILAQIRENELRSACSILGVNEVHLLGYGDSGMMGTEFNNDPLSFWQTPMDRIVCDIVTQIRRFRPHIVITYDSNGGYGHPDHIQAHRATILAVEAASSPQYPFAGNPWSVAKLYYTVFPKKMLRTFITLAKDLGIPSPFGIDETDPLPFAAPDENITTIIDCSSTLTRKRQAMRAHKSQIAPDWPMLIIPEEIAQKYLAEEYYQLVMDHNFHSRKEDDMFSNVEPDSLLSPISSREMPHTLPVTS